MITNSLEAAVVERSAQRRAVRESLGTPEGSEPEPAVQVRGLRKAYGSVQAVDGIDLTVQRGEVLAVLGPNGAGKTTTVEILEGHRRADAGTVSVLGFDPARRERAFRERIGIVLQEGGLDAALTVREAIELYSAAYPRPREAREVIDLVGLAEKADARVATLSGGQRRRLDTALGIAGDPDLIFLDEPTTGFDPAARRASWELIAGLRSLGKTILLTTHYMDEAQHLADRVVVIARGRVIAEGTPDSLGRDGHSIVSFRLPVFADGRLRDLRRSEGFPDGRLRDLRRSEGFPDGTPLPDGARVERGVVTFETHAPTRDLAPILAWAAGRGMELEGLAVGRPSLEDVYLQLTEETR